MTALKSLSAGILVLTLIQLAPAQSLAEAAKKEKERRESLKGKSALIVTNADLRGTKKKPAIATPTPAESENPAQPASAAAKAAEPAVDVQAEAKKKLDEKRTELEGRLAKSREMVELLTLKMNALQLQFFSFNSMESKEKVQRQISDTNLRLQAAADEVKKIQDELDQLLIKGWKSEFPPAANE